MPRQPQVTFANLVCRFGDRHVLLDLAEEVIVPAFLDVDLRRSHGPNRYFFLDTVFEEVHDPDSAENLPFLVIRGRLVKDTELRREQVFVQGKGLLADARSMESAPSAFFTLILNNHKLIFYPEMSGAPSLQAFTSTLQKFAREKHTAFIEHSYNKLQEEGRPTTKLALLAEYPAPEVRALPLATRSSIETFLATFERLTSIQYRLLPTNEELSMEETYNALRANSNEVGAANTAVTQTNKTGLNKGIAAQQIASAAGSGNQEVILRGSAPDGSKISGDNQHFKLSLTVDLESTDESTTRQLVGLLANQARSGVLSLDVPLDNGDKLRKLLSWLRKGRTSRNG